VTADERRFIFIVEYLAGERAGKNTAFDSRPRRGLWRVWAHVRLRWLTKLCFGHLLRGEVNVPEGSVHTAIHL
jgi:hypothetical protein